MSNVRVRITYSKFQEKSSPKAESVLPDQLKHLIKEFRKSRAVHVIKDVEDVITSLSFSQTSRFVLENKRAHFFKYWHSWRFLGVSFNSGRLTSMLLFKLICQSNLRSKHKTYDQPDRISNRFSLNVRFTLIERASILLVVTIMSCFSGSG